MFSVGGVGVGSGGGVDPVDSTVRFTLITSVVVAVTAKTLLVMIRVPSVIQSM